MDADVPLLIPEVNQGHLRILEAQQKKRKWKVMLVTNPNCITVGLVLSLKPLMDAFGIDTVYMTSMQAISGAVISRSSCI